MNLQEFMPWNWFKHEQESGTQSAIPIHRSDRSPKEQRHDQQSKRQGPQDPMMKLHQDIDLLFENAFRNFPTGGWHTPWLNSELMPKAFEAKLDVASDDSHYHINVETPGLEEKDIQLELQKNALIIRGEKKEENETKNRHYYRTERRYGSFQRVLALPDDADTDAIHAIMKNGLLEISLPRKASATSERKKIPINSQHSPSLQ